MIRARRVGMRWALALALGAVACRRSDGLAPVDTVAEPAAAPRARAVTDGAEPASVQFVDESFDELYPLFLLPKLAKGPKTQLWNDYQLKFVRWTGRLVSFTPNGATIRQLNQTVTFDVSLYVEPSARPRLHQLHPGDRITYVGQLSSYDDLLRTFYLVHGAVITVAPTDAGAQPRAN